MINILDTFNSHGLHHVRTHACMHMCSEQCVTFWSSEEFLFSFTRKLARSISSHLCVLTKFQFDHVFFSGLFQWNYCASKYCVWISLQPNESLRIFSKRINHISYVLWPYSSLLILGMIRNYNQNERDKKTGFHLSLNHWITWESAYAFGEIVFFAYLLARLKLISQIKWTAAFFLVVAVIALSGFQTLPILAKQRRINGMADAVIGWSALTRDLQSTID